MYVADAPHLRVLRLLRDEGPVSRAELGDRLELTRPRLIAEVDRLVTAGLIAEAGMAASRGGRRSTLVELNPRLRFAAVDLGASSIDIEVVNGRLEPVATYREPSDIRSGPRTILQRVNELLHKARTDGAYDRLDAVGIGVPGPVSFRDGVPVSPPIMPGWDRYPVRELLAREHGCPAVVDNDVNIMAIGERHGGVAHSVDDFLFVKIGTGIGCGIHLGGTVYRGVDGCAGDIGHIQVDAGGPVCSCGNTGCLEALFSGFALARDALAAARSGESPALAERLAAYQAAARAAAGESAADQAGDEERVEPNITITARDVADGAAEGDVTCIRLIREGGRRVGGVLATLVSFSNPSMIVIGGGLAQLGHVLLAEIRSVVYRRSLPLATGNLPVVLSELGSRAGVTGAAVLASDTAFEQAS
ncbi:ROK family transcriptional regulator [Actinoplanes solisilvae]|uniref:ROK family transcriptional regulator n=1 Tax=Actinoplanes solisilvae TaxID=2486853 RepID=UPI000FD9966B|nr:ROK family transcriptional regulator [Actinoplanes solisilvae]